MLSSIKICICIIIWFADLIFRYSNIYTKVIKFDFDTVNFQKLFFDSVNWIKHFQTFIEINWFSVWLIGSHCYKTVIIELFADSSTYNANSLIAIAVYCSQAQGNLELKVREIYLR